MDDTQIPAATPPVVESADHRNNHRVIMAFIDQKRANGFAGAGQLLVTGEYYPQTTIYLGTPTVAT